MKPIALGLVGYGKIARDQHEPALAASGDFELVAIADPAARHDSLPSYADVGPMLSAHPEITALSLCMPPRLRAEIASKAIEAGRHVLLEKPPATTVAEARELARAARERRVALFTAWHSQEAAAVDLARARLAKASIRAVHVTWKEDVRVWHPGQGWIWQPGGFGVFDPGINALSILTAILPGELLLLGAELATPANCATPIAARLDIAGEGFPVTAEFDFRQTGPQSWDIVIETEHGELVLSNGGNALSIDGTAQPLAEEAEYPRLYARFAELIRAGQSEVDLAPLRLVEDALAQGSRLVAEPFEEEA
jgi:D-galactose 1-dehydrogenase